MWFLPNGFNKPIFSHLTYTIWSYITDIITYSTHTITVVYNSQFYHTKTICSESINVLRKITLIDLDNIFNLSYILDISFKINA